MIKSGKQFIRIVLSLLIFKANMNNRIIKFRAYTEISHEWLGMKYDVPHNYNNSVMQYTGITDMEGKEIYEGDIVRTGDEIGEVQYDDQQGAFIILLYPNNKKQKSGCFNLASTFPSPAKYIIGNIYENPELVK